jgi:hypothetical protein
LLYPKLDKIKELIKSQALLCKFDIVIKIENGDTPAVHLQKEMLDLAHELGAEFDFDLYVV